MGLDTRPVKRKSIKIRYGGVHIPDGFPHMSTTTVGYCMCLQQCCQHPEKGCICKVCPCNHGGKSHDEAREDLVKELECLAQARSEIPRQESQNEIDVREKTQEPAGG